MHSTSHAKRHPTSSSLGCSTRRGCPRPRARPQQRALSTAVFFACRGLDHHIPHTPHTDPSPCRPRWQCLAFLTRASATHAVAASRHNSPRLCASRFVNGSRGRQTMLPRMVSGSRSSCPRGCRPSSSSTFAHMPPVVDCGSPYRHHGRRSATTMASSR